MRIRRNLLFAIYKAFKKLGGIRLVNALSNRANILTFHRVNDYDRHFLTTQVGVFDDLMSILRTHYNVVPLATILQGIQRKQAFEPNTVAITFDDGYRDNLVYAAPILCKYGIPATFFVTTGYINTNRVFPWDFRSEVKHQAMNWDEVRELARMGFEIGGHTVNHVDLGACNVDAARSEIVGCKADIEREIDHQINSFAFPYGARVCITPATLQLVRDAGFSCCCSVYGGKVTPDSDPFELHRVSMYRTITEMLMELDNFMTYFEGEMKVNLFGLQIATSLHQDETYKDVGY